MPSTCTWSSLSETTDSREADARSVRGASPQADEVASTWVGPLARRRALVVIGEGRDAGGPGTGRASRDSRHAGRTENACRAARMHRPGVAVDAAGPAVPRGSSQTRQAAGAAWPGDAARAGRHGIAAVRAPRVDRQGDGAVKAASASVSTTAALA